MGTELTQARDQPKHGNTDTGTTWAWDHGHGINTGMGTWAQDQHGHKINMGTGSTQGWEHGHGTQAFCNYFAARGPGAEPLASWRPGANTGMGTCTGFNHAAIIRQPGVRGRSPWQAGDPVLQEWSERSSSPCRRHGS